MALRNSAPATPNKLTRPRLSVSTPREYESNGEKKTWWTNIGSAFENEKGQIVVKLNAHPMGDTLLIQEFKEGEAAASA